MSSIPELLARQNNGESEAFQLLYSLLYPEIKRVARARLAQSGGVAGLNTTALVHEGFLRLAEQEGLQGQSRGQFFAYVGLVLRSVVIDHLRGEGRDKRGAGQVLVTLSQAQHVTDGQGDISDLLALDRALQRMAAIDRNLYELIEMVSFAGLTIAEVAEQRGLSSRSINRDLIKARTLLRVLLGETG
jgi:RNA polymerase sigma factor (TIGR02999 family)